MLTIQILFWLCVALLFFSVIWRMVYKHTLEIELPMFIGALGVIFIGLTWIGASDAQNNRNLRDRCEEACSGQFVFDHSKCVCIKVVEPKPVEKLDACGTTKEQSKCWRSACAAGYRYMLKEQEKLQ